MTSDGSKRRKMLQGHCSADFAFAARAPDRITAGCNKPKGTISLRVSPAEREALERAAAGTSLSAYVRERLFGETVTPRRTRGKHPVKDYEALGRLLATLGRSGLSERLNAALRQVEEGRIIVSAGLEEELRLSCTLVAEMRRDCVKALGLSADRSS